MHNPTNTIDELLEIKKWIKDKIRDSHIQDSIVNYAPIVRVELVIDLSDNSVPDFIMESVKNNYYEGKLNGS